MSYNPNPIPFFLVQSSPRFRRQHKNPSLSLLPRSIPLKPDNPTRLLQPNSDHQHRGRPAASLVASRPLHLQPPIKPDPAAASPPSPQQPTPPRSNHLRSPPTQLRPSPVLLRRQRTSSQPRLDPRSALAASDQNHRPVTRRLRPRASTVPARRPPPAGDNSSPPRTAAPVADEPTLDLRHPRPLRARQTPPAIPSTASSLLPAGKPLSRPCSDFPASTRLSVHASRTASIRSTQP